MKTTNLWRFAQHDSPYYDFEKELYSLPDVGNTSVDMRLTFDADYRTCYYTISLHNDDGNTRDWEKTHFIPWAAGLEVLRRDNTTIPEELTK